MASECGTKVSAINTDSRATGNLKGGWASHRGCCAAQKEIEFEKVEERKETFFSPTKTVEWGYFISQSMQDSQVAGSLFLPPPQLSFPHVHYCTVPS